MNAPIGSRVRSRFTTVGGATLAVLVAILASAPIASAGQPADIQLETGPNKRTLRLGDIASANQIAVVFQDGNRSYLRWSTDGTTFTPRHALRNGRRATNPRVAACGDQVWTASEWRSDAPQNVGLDLFDTALDTTVRFAVADGLHPDVACFGSVVAVTWWNADHAYVRFYNGPCVHSCVYIERDLGPADFDNPARVAATDNGIAVSWIADPDRIDEALAVQHFQVSTAGSMHVTPGAVARLMPGSNLFSPVVAGDGSRVVVAYSRMGQTLMRISESYGATFGPRIFVSRYCRDCPEGGSRPMGIDARDGDILVEVLAGAGIPPGIDSKGFLTHNDGSNWLKTPSSSGLRFGVLLGDTLAEVWDDSVERGFPYPSRPRAIMFHIRNI